MQLTDKQMEIMDAAGHLLVTGGPGSGKTTVSILKAAKVAQQDLRLGQQILFLSFARATVSRVVEAIEYEHKIPKADKRKIEVETYHSFFWRILKTHGYLLGLPRRLSVLTPPGEAVELSTIRSDYASESKLDEVEKSRKHAQENEKRLLLARNEGRVCFCLFAHFAGEILHRSRRIRKLISAKYPFIIFDEFQDTNAEQWHVVKAFGDNSTLFALADPEQRIYDWIGADPERLNHYKETFVPTEVNLGTDNHRSAGTDIVKFGNDILTGELLQEKYSGVGFCLYEANSGQAWTSLVTTTYAARKRLISTARKDWSLAILVPTKMMTRLVSDIFRSPPAGMAKISHTAAIEMEAAILGAETIAFLMQPDIDGDHFEKFISLLCNYFQGKGGGAPTKRDLSTAVSIQKAYANWLAKQAVGKDINKGSILVAMLNVYTQVRAFDLTGDPDRDWRAVRSILGEGSCAHLKNMAEEVRNIRLLERGMQLRQDLAQDWRDNGSYANALAITQQAFMQEHFSTNVKPETGVVIMNMHKAKGKQFDEVIIFDSWPTIVRGRIVANANRIVRSNVRENINEQSRHNFRVSVTRGKSRTTILTPRCDVCVLLVQ